MVIRSCFVVAVAVVVQVTIVFLHQASYTCHAFVPSTTRATTAFFAKDNVRFVYPPLSKQHQQQQQQQHISKSVLFSTTNTDKTDLISEGMNDSNIEEFMMSNNKNNNNKQTPTPSASTSLPSPGIQENEKFICDDTVPFWNNYQPPKTLEESLQKLNEINARVIRKGPDAVDYMTRHLARYGYFGTNTILGGLGTVLHDQLVVANNNNDDNSNNDNKSGGTMGSNNILNIQNIFNKFTVSNDMFSPLSMVNRAVELATVFEQDYQNIQNGSYIKPYDMYEPTRQSNPFYVGQQTGRFVREAINTLTKRSRGTQKDKDIWITNDYAPDLYPKYYRTAFHYQTNGWMSKESADVYETSTETLFMGGQDAMQRQAIAPIKQAYQKLVASGEIVKNKRNGPRPFRVLEVACGTGRFATFLRDNLPLDTDYTAVDLSPFYLEATRENDSNWRNMKKNQLSRRRSQGGSANDKSGNDRKMMIAPIRVVQAQAENLPFEDDEFDAVVCVHLFHELPRPIRSRVAAEMARVVKRGSGIVVFDDSIQLGDVKWLDGRISKFEDFNEPYYQDYLLDDLPSHFEKVGLQCETKTQCFRSKCLTFSKP